MNCTEKKSPAMRKHPGGWPNLTRRFDVRHCTVTTCSRKHLANGYCNMHYRRLKRHGSLDLPMRDPQDRFWPKVNKNGPIPSIRSDLGPCWIWEAQSVAEGYGKLSITGGSPAWAHRFAYETRYGVIPKGLHIDHLCMVRLCVNPDHLEAVTQAENNRRAAVETMRRRSCA